MPLFLHEQQFRLDLDDPLLREHAGIDDPERLPSNPSTSWRTISTGKPSTLANGSQS